MAKPGTHPITSFEAVTPNDSAEIAPTRGLFIGTAGNLAIIGVDDTNPVTLVNVDAGEHAYAVKKVLATGTSATGIVALR